MALAELEIAGLRFSISAASPVQLAPVDSLYRPFLDTEAPAEPPACRATLSGP